MLTVSDIIVQAIEQTEENATTYSEGLMLNYINAALADLTPLAKMLTTQGSIALTITGSNAVAVMPTTAHEPVAVFYTPMGGAETFVRQLPVHNPVSRGWIHMTGQVALRNMGGTIPTGSTLRVDFYRRLTRAVLLTDVPDLPEQYRNLLVLYCCAKIQERAAQTALKTDFYSEYLIGRQQFALQRIWDMEPHNRSAVEQMRNAGLLGVQGGR